MLSRLKRRPSPATVIALVALFVALALSVQLAAWAWVRTTPATRRREMERATAARRGTAR